MLVGTLATQRCSGHLGPTAVPTGPLYAQVVSQSSLILFGGGAAFGLSGNCDSFEQKGLADNLKLNFYSSTSYAF